MKKYDIFAGDFHYPRTGINDFLCQADSMQMAMFIMAQFTEDDFDWVQIVCHETRQLWRFDWSGMDGTWKRYSKKAYTPATLYSKRIEEAKAAWEKRNE